MKSLSIAQSEEDFDPIERLPEIASDMMFPKSEFISEGAHAFIYKVLATSRNEQNIRCLKIFRKGWDSPYLLETTAYAYLRQAGVESFVPEFFGWALRTQSDWGLPCVPDEGEGQYYGILIEWVEGAEPLSEKNINSGLAVNFIRGLNRIHSAGVLHNDTFIRNMLVVPSTKRSVWIDFSCAKIGMDEDYQDQEMWGAAGTVVRMVSDHILSDAKFKLVNRTAEEARSEVFKTYSLLSMSLFRRVCTLIYVSWLFIEGLVAAFCKSITPSQAPAVTTDGMKISTMYFLSAGLLLVILHYISRPIPRFYFRLITFTHQIIFGAISLWTYATAEPGHRASSGFRLVLLSFCALGETFTFTVKIVKDAGPGNQNPTAFSCQDLVVGNL